LVSPEQALLLQKPTGNKLADFSANVPPLLVFTAGTRVQLTILCFVSPPPELLPHKT
jgi:hypothetical protein